MSKLITFSEALARIHQTARLKGSAFLAQSELKPLTEAVGRVCSEDVFGREAVPHFNNSSMDGFAVRSEETGKASQAPVQFNVKGRILAGDVPLLKPDLSAGSCYEIMTGAPVPEGYDAVFKIEDVQLNQDGSGRTVSIVVNESIERFQNFRHQGEDFAVGAKILHSGTVLLPEHIMALASVGVSKLQVLRRVKVAVLSTGSELASLDETILASGKIRNSTSPYLMSALSSFGVQAKYYGTVSDEREVFTQRIQSILSDQPDLIITTGAVSKGSHDFIPDVICRMGAEIIFHNLAIRPGKPQLFAQFPKNGPVFFGIPGNPVSTAVGLRFLVDAYLRGLTGKASEAPIPARLSEEVKKPPGLLCFFKARLEFQPGGAKVTSLAGQPSFIVSSLLQANAWVVFNEETSLVPAGAEVFAYPLYPFLYDYTGEQLPVRGARHSENCC